MDISQWENILTANEGIPSEAEQRSETVKGFLSPVLHGGWQKTFNF